MEKLICILLFLIIILLIFVSYALMDVHYDLKKINATIIDIHSGYKYKKVYESKRYEKKIQIFYNKNIGKII